MKVNVILVNGKVECVIQDYKEALSRYRQLRDYALLKIYSGNDKYEVEEDVDGLSISITVKSPEVYSVKMFNCQLE